MTLCSPESLPDYVPGQILARSDGLGWKGLALRSYGYKGQDVMVPAMRDFMLVSYRVGVTPMQRRFDGRWSQAVCGPGTVSLLTRSQVSHWHWTEDVTVTHLYLTEAFVSAIAAEVTGRGVAEVTLGDILRTDDPIVTAAIDTVAAEARSPEFGAGLYVESIGRQLVIHLLRKYASVRVREARARGTLPAAHRSRAQDFIEENLGRALELGEIAAELNMSAGTFARQFRRTTGMAPYAYVTERRLEHARQLLEETDLPTKQVAATCGFCDQAHLTRMFSRRYGVTPAAFRQSRAG
jgi:AraC family transcriptional regulator